MPTLLRTWNLFHGRATGPDGRIAATDRLREMVERVACQGSPAIVCLQEVPPALLPRLADWSGMDVYGAIAQPASLGPLPIPATLAQRLTGLAPATLRGAFSGQANAILVAPGLRATEHTELHLNEPGIVHQTAALLGLDPVARVAWGRERRVAQALRVELPGGRSLRLVATHATSFPSDPAVPDAEVARAAAWLERLAAGDDVAVLAGDLNVPAAASPALQGLAAAGFSPPGPWIDHVLVRPGARATAPVTWPDEARTTADGLLLSDHSPVEVTIA